MSVCMPRCCFGEYANAAHVKSSVKLFGIVGAATKTFVGLVPHGNTGGANVSAFRRMPIAPDLQRLIDAAGG